MKFFNNPEYNAIKFVLLFVLLTSSGYFVFTYRNDSGRTRGQVVDLPTDQADAALVPETPAEETVSVEGGPIIETGNVIGVTATAATFASKLTSTGEGDVTEIIFNYGPTASYGTSASLSGPVFEAGPVMYDATDLSCSTEYHFRSFALSESGLGYGSDKTFTTATCE